MSQSLTLISHTLCPYVQRAAISLCEKGVPFDREYVDLSRKPEWFSAVSPLGKVPVLLVDDRPIFESAVILEFLEETQPNPLHPECALERAEHRSWIEYGSALLNDIARFYSAGDVAAFEAARTAIAGRWQRIETQLGTGPWFAGRRFALVDAVYGPVFRYFDTFDAIGDFRFFCETPKTDAWRRHLRNHPSVRTAVTEDYGTLLHGFLERRGSHLSRHMAA